MIPQDVVAMRDEAEANISYDRRCINGEKVFYAPSDRAYLPGHIYSEAGVSEYQISQCCEYHFDEWLGEDE